MADFDWSSLDIVMPVESVSSSQLSRINRNISELVELGYLGAKDLNQLDAELREEKRKFKVVEDMARRRTLNADMDILHRKRVQQAFILARQRAQFLATTQAYDAERLVKQQSYLWVKGVAEAAAMGAIQTDAQFIRQIARSFESINRAVLESHKRLALTMANNTRLWFAYQEAMKTLTTQEFTLWVNDNKTIPEAILTRERLMALARVLKEEVQKIVYLALQKAIAECVKGLNPIAWPKRYTDLMMAALNMGRLDNTINLQNTTSLDSFRVVADFANIFGDYSDLTTAFHRGALLEDGNKVKLPYFGGALKNPDYKRYKFWLAIVSGKKVFYGDATSNKRQAISKVRRSLKGKTERNLKAREELEQSFGKRKRTIKAKSLRDLGGMKGVRDKEDAKIQERIDEIDAANAYQTHRRETLKRDRDLTPIKIPPRLWKDTIENRIDTWSKQGVAPIWLYLEFGQLKWKPIIPPRGLTFRFLTIARGMVDARVKEIMDKELAEAGLMRVGSGKTTRFAASGTPLRFGSYYGLVQRRGTRLSDKVVQETLRGMRETEVIIKRNVDEARAVYKAPPANPREFSVVNEFWRQIRSQDIIDQQYRRTVGSAEGIEIGVNQGPHPAPYTIKVVPRAYRTTRSKLSTASKDPNSFGNRMLGLKRKRQFEADRVQAAALGEDVFTYRKRIAREALQRQKADARAKATAKRRAERAREKARKKKKPK